VKGNSTMSIVPTNDEHLRAEVRARYAQTALRVLGTEAEATPDDCCGESCCTPGTAAAAKPGGAVEAVQEAACCASSCCTASSDGGAITAGLYTQDEIGALPVAATLASLGCGNPTALAELKAGEHVLDLGSGGGIDVLLSARRVGPTGFVYGLDMTDEMLALAERNRQEAKVENVRFLKGVIEAIPLADNSVDVIISNCVINLSADKGQVLREAARVLRPGGRLAIADIVVQGEMPAALRADFESWSGCIAGALEEAMYRKLLAAAGLVDIEIEVTRRYALDDLRASGAGSALDTLSAQEQSAVDGKFVSAFIRARKPEVH
jgi:arsenite methyltransferase